MTNVKARYSGSCKFLSISTFSAVPVPETRGRRFKSLRDSFFCRLPNCWRSSTDTFAFPCRRTCGGTSKDRDPPADRLLSEGISWTRGGLSGGGGGSRGRFEGCSQVSLARLLSSVRWRLWASAGADASRVFSSASSSADSDDADEEAEDAY